jgi:hypothetical protein
MVIFVYQFNLYLRRTLRELQNNYSDDYHYFKWYGLYVKTDDAMEKLYIANRLLNNVDEEVLIALINNKLHLISQNVDQLLYTYVIDDVDKDIRELMETVSLVSNLKSSAKKEIYMKACNDLTSRLNVYKMSIYSTKK